MWLEDKEKNIEEAKSPANLLNCYFRLEKLHFSFFFFNLIQCYTLTVIIIVDFLENQTRPTVVTSFNEIVIRFCFLFILPSRDENMKMDSIRYKFVYLIILKIHVKFL